MCTAILDIPQEFSGVVVFVEVDSLQTKPRLPTMNNMQQIDGRENRREERNWKH